MKPLILLLAIILFSCKEETTFSVQPELKPYYDSFMAEAKKRNFTSFDRIDNLIMIIRPNTTKDYGGLGVTRKITGGQHYIYIDQDFFNQHPNAVETVVFHELGHCYLDREHNTSMFSLMNPEVGGIGWASCTAVDMSKCDLKKSSLIDELFQHTGS